MLTVLVTLVLLSGIILTLTLNAVKAEEKGRYYAIMSLVNDLLRNLTEWLLVNAKIFLVPIHKSFIYCEYKHFIVYSAKVHNFFFSAKFNSYFITK